MRPRYPAAVAAAGLLLLTPLACDDGSTEPDPPVASALTRVSGDAQTGPVGEALDPLVVRVTDQFGDAMAGVTVSWRVVEGDGAVSPQTSATGSDGDASATWTLGTTAGEGHRVEARVTGLPTVAFSATAEPGAPAAVMLDPDAATFDAVGDTVRVDASVEDRYGNAIDDPVLTFRSLEEAVATVDEAGLVTARRNGTAGIVAEVDAAADTAVVTVEQAIAAIQVAPEQVTLTALGETATLTATVLDPNGEPIEGEAVAWSSSDVGVAIVDETGLVVARSQGTANVVAETDGVADTAVVTVQPAAASLEIAPDEVVLTAAGDTIRLTATATDAQGVPIQDPVVTWASLNQEVATVSAEGLVTAQGAGDAEIRAESDGTSATLVVSVSVESGVKRGWIAKDPARPSAWESPLNWAPAGRPNARDTARVITATKTSPTLTADAAVLRLVVDPDAAVALADNVLTATEVVADGPVSGTGEIELAGEEATAQGELPSLRVVGDATLTAATTVVGSCVIDGGSLANDGFPFTIRKP